MASLGGVARRASACLILLAVAASAPARQGSPPASASHRALPLAALDVLELPFVDNGTLLAEDEAAPPGGPLRYALVSEVLVTPATHGTWEPLDDGSRLWRLRVFSPGATDLNFGFTFFRLPEGATLHVSSESEPYHEGPFTAADNRGHLQLWTPVVPGDRAVIELRLPASAPPPALELGAVGHGYRDLFDRIDDPAPRSGACNIDVVCPEGDAWRDEINSAGVYSEGGGLMCSGTMIMDVPRSFRPFFLTANHCGIRAANAPSMVVYWNFQTSACRGARDGSLADNQTGATFRSRLAGPDFTLVELDAMPDPAWNVYWAGWDRSDLEFTGSVGIHHPNTDEKAITFNDDLVTHTNSCIGAGTDTHWNIDNYEAGTTEPGSSGSGLWRADNHLLVGVLSGGAASCTRIDYDCYGRFGVAWDSGAAPDQRLREWLDPAGAGDLTVPGAYPGGAPVGRLELDAHRGADSCGFAGAGDANGAWEPGETVAVAATLRAVGAGMTGIRGTLTSSTPGVTILDGDATWPDLAAGASADADAPLFTVSLDPSLACGAKLSFHLQASANEGGPFDFDFTHDVGLALAPAVPVAILDNQTATSALDVAQDLAVSGLGVRVRFTHSYVGDLVAELVSPAGTRVILFSRPPNGAGNCPAADLDATFLDAAAVDAQSQCGGGSPWHAGDVRPMQPLSAFDGESTAGRWELLLRDEAGGDEGQLVDWGLVTSPALTGTCLPCADQPPCVGVEIAPGDLRVRKSGGDVILDFPQPALDACVLGAQVRSSATCRPATGRGSWPTDPAFADVTAEDTDPGAPFRHAPAAGTRYYLVAQSLSDGSVGPSGSY